MLGFKVKYDNIYMWVVLFCHLTLRMTIFLNCLAGRYIVDFVKQNIM